MNSTNKQTVSKREYDIETLCTCYTLDYLKRQADAMRAGIELHEEKAAVEILEMIPDLSIEVLEEAISHYDDEKYKYYRDNYWCNNDRDYDIETLCTCYSDEDLIERINNIRNGNTEKPESKTNEVLYTAELDVLEEAVKRYDEEKYQRVRDELKKT